MKDAETQKKNQHNHYIRNKEAYQSRSNARRLALRLVVDEIKSKPCVDCGIQYAPYVMQFDHVVGNKIKTVSQLVSYKTSLDNILSEIEKCEIVCANCHAERTHSRLEKGLDPDTGIIVE